MEILKDLNTIGMSILVIFMWISYSIGEGMREAYYYDSEMRTDRPHSNIHWLFFVQRGIVLIIIGVCLETILLPIALICMFPFIHDGVYYMQRNDLDVRIYLKRFTDSSKNSTAYFEFTFLDRLFFLFGSIISLVAYFLLILFC